VLKRAIVNRSIFQNVESGPTHRRMDFVGVCSPPDSNRTPASISNEVGEGDKILPDGRMGFQLRWLERTLLRRSEHLTAYPDFLINYTHLESVAPGGNFLCSSLIFTPFFLIPDPNLTPGPTALNRARIGSPGKRCRCVEIARQGSAD
jgi:hypothetical protein